MTDRRSPAELEGEQEVDLASAWKRIEQRWWLPVGGLLVGAVIGLVLALSGGSVWRAETIVYLGQPFAPLGGGQIQSLATNPRTVGEIVRSEAVLRDVSDDTGIPVSKLRSSISTTELTATGQVRGGIIPLIEIAVKGDAEPRKIEAAADALAARVVRASPSSSRRRSSSWSSRSRSPSRSSRRSRAGSRQPSSSSSTLIQDDSIPLDREAAPER